jgi:putative drug exporter of the RND superfamily
MSNVARWSFAHRRTVIGTWIVLLVVSFAATRAVGNRFYNSVSLPGTDSLRATTLLRRTFPAVAGDADAIVFHARTGSVTAPSVRAAVTPVLARISRLPHVTGVVSPYAARSQISSDGSIAYATVRFDERGDALPTKDIKAVVSAAEAARSANLEVELGGAAIEETQRPTLGAATAIGIAAAIIVLLVSFGSLLAMGLPIVTALFGLGTAGAFIAVLTHLIHTPDFAQQLAFMIGLGVGIDYALLVVSRYRDAYRTNGANVEEAVATAVGTAGRSVIFAGGTVVIALLGLFSVGLRLLDGVALAASTAVVLMMVASLTLLPALLAGLGHRIGRQRRSVQPVGRGEGWWGRWVAVIQRRPLVAAVAATALLLVLASPLLGLRLAFSDAGNDRPATTTRHAYDLIAQGFGPGFNGPLQLAVALPKQGQAAALTRLTTAVRATPGVAFVAPPQLRAAGDAASITVVPTTAPQSSQTYHLVKQLRKTVLPPVERATGASVFVGGVTASQVDFAHVLSNKLPIFIAIVIALSALLLFVVFRSALIPLQAAAMNLLSIGAALGVVQAIFERGWLHSLVGAQRSPIEAFIPVIVFAIVFGLSMDYEVFLVSRIHEEWQHSGDASAAIRAGVVRTGRVITAAAAVMIVVFSSFAASDNHILKLFGLSLAVAVFLDAVVIRSLLLPAVLELSGRATWKFPAWLDRRLPRLAIEPPSPEVDRIPVSDAA